MAHNLISSGDTWLGRCSLARYSQCRWSGIGTSFLDVCVNSYALRAYDTFAVSLMMPGKNTVLSKIFSLPRRSTNRWCSSSASPLLRQSLLTAIRVFSLISPRVDVVSAMEVSSESSRLNTHTRNKQCFLTKVAIFLLNYHKNDTIMRLHPDRTYGMPEDLALNQPLDLTVGHSSVRVEPDCWRKILSTPPNYPTRVAVVLNTCPDPTPGLSLYYLITNLVL